MVTGILKYHHIGHFESGSWLQTKKKKHEVKSVNNLSAQDKVKHWGNLCGIQQTCKLRKGRSDKG